MLRGFLSKRKKWTTVLIIAVILLSIPTVCSYLLLNRKTFYEGLSVEGVDISGMNMAEARSALQKEVDDRYGNACITLQSEGRQWTVGLRDLRFRLACEEALEEAYRAGRTGSIFRRLYMIAKLKLNKLDITAKPDFERKQLENLLKEIKKEIDVESRDASLKYENGRFIFDKEIIGREMDIDTNRKLVENCILDRKFEKINLDIKEKAPRIFFDDIKEIKQVVSSFYTTFNPGDANRTHNIKLACQKINGTILLPNEIFSMNRALGPRTIENGYKDAPVIFKNELIKGPGGGVCQVTTTLYVAVLKALLGVIERTHHSRPLGYVSPGQDATIAEGSIDFKFQNNRVYGEENYAVYIYANVTGNRIDIRILGKKFNEDYVVKLKSQVIKRYEDNEIKYIIDGSIPYGQRVEVQKAIQGMRVIVYREIYSKNGELLDREKVSEDVYRPVRAQVKINPEENAELVYENEPE